MQLSGTMYILLTLYLVVHAVTTELSV